MDPVMKFLRENLDLSEQEIKDYVQRNRVRLTLGLVVFVIEILFVWSTIRSANWNKRNMFGRTFCLLWLIVGLLIFEVLRCLDPIIKKRFLKEKAN